MELVDWCFDNPGKCLLVLLVLFFALSVVSDRDTKDRKGIFMTPCLQDHKQYECDVLWNHARESKNTYIPVVIPVGR